MRKVEQSHLTPRTICESLDIGIEPVLAWIHSGQLRASNISNSPLRPRWRIAKDDLKTFLEHRSNQQKGHDRPAARRRPRREFA
jgi:predicted site-specific integrase-resolvase